MHKAMYNNKISNINKYIKNILNYKFYVNTEVAEEFQNDPDYRPDIVMNAPQPAITNPNVGESQPQQYPDNYRHKHHHH